MGVPELNLRGNRHEKEDVGLRADTSFTQNCTLLVHWEDSEGWDGEGGARGDQDGEHM